jgi:two-component system sensor histidine kinase BaeS
VTDPDDRPYWTQERRRRWMAQQAGRRGWPGRGRSRYRRGFGCLGGLVFLVVASSLLIGTSTILGRLGPAPAIIAVVAVMAVLLTVGRQLRRAGRSMDEIVLATDRVRAGDYGVRIGTPVSALPPVRELADGFDTMVERLERDEAQRRSLLNDVSHELRTPLSVIAGSIEAMLDGVHPADEAHLAPVLEETRVMNRLIDDLRTLALSEAGTLALHPEPTDPDVLLHEVARSFSGAAAASGVTVRTDAPDDLPIVEVDPVRLREVIANLVANSVRHTPAGGSVVISAAVLGDELVIRVADTGTGIDPAVRSHVFDRFVKGADSGGSGLGLAIARYLVEAHGGTLDVEATGRAGTTFRASLPLTTG